MVLIIGVWIYNDIILRPIFRKMLLMLKNEETKQGEDTEESYDLPSAPTKSTKSTNLQESSAIRDMSNSVMYIQGL